LRSLETAAADSLVNISLEYRSAAEWDTTVSTGKVTFPWLVAFFPHAPEPFWEGPVTPENVRKLVDSPARQTLVQRLAQGDAAVWIFLETENPPPDSSFARILHENLKELSSALKAPATSRDSSGICVIHPDSAEISVRFSMLSIPANAPEEIIFRRMLLGIEADLLLLDRPLEQPVAIPVFGRGRALYALIGRGIHEKTIRRACESIIGWCSCEVKSENPGVDLLVRTDWKKIVPERAVPPEKLPPLTGLSRFIQTVADSQSKSHPLSEKLVPVEPVASDSIVPVQAAAGAAGSTPSDNLLILVGWIFLGGLVLVFSVTILLLLRKKSGKV
jgi:hypothetical protein